VAPDGKAGLLYQSPQRHVRAMALDAGGNLLIGTEPNGTIARIRIRHSEAGALPTAGPVSVLLETGAKEITSLFTGSDGVVYASAVGTFSESPLAGPGMQGSKSMEAPPGSTGGSILYRILPDGAAEQMWSSHEDIVYAGRLTPDGKILLGIGNHGLLLRIEDQNSFATIASTNTGQVTGMIVQADGKVLVSTANPGKIFRLASQVEGEGSFESIVFDAKAPARWGRITWSLDGESKGGNRVSFFVRCGNTSDPEDNWSPWQGPYQSGQNVECQVARFAQWRAVFASGGGAPRIAGVSLAYLPKNIRPVVDEIVLQSPGVEVQGTSWNSVDTKMAALRRPGGSPSASIFAVVAAPPPDNLQGTIHKGFQSVLWNAHDDNGDDLAFSVYCQREGEEQWTLLKSGIMQRFYSWSTANMPDGLYRLKIMASDEASNPAADALQSERISETFQVDNTPPSVSDLHINNTNNLFHLLFQATDSRSIISSAEFSIDSGPWKVAFPVGLLSDANSESYDIALNSVTPGEHTFKVRVYDEFENIATAATQVMISSGNQASGIASSPSADPSPPHASLKKATEPR
jgi:hypothetical protein